MNVVKLEGVSLQHGSDEQSSEPASHNLFEPPSCSTVSEPLECDPDTLVSHLQNGGIHVSVEEGEVITGDVEDSESSVGLGSQLRRFQFEGVDSTSKKADSPVFRNHQSRLDVRKLLDEKAHYLKVLSSTTRDVNLLMENARHYKIRMKELEAENNDLKKALNALEDSQMTLLQTAEHFHLKFLELQTAMKSTAKILSGTVDIFSEDSSQRPVIEKVGTIASTKTQSKSSAIPACPSKNRLRPKVPPRIVEVPVGLAEAYPAVNSERLPSVTDAIKRARNVPPDVVKIEILRPVVCEAVQTTSRSPVTPQQTNKIRNKIKRRALRIRGSNHRLKSCPHCPMRCYNNYSLNRHICARHGIHTVRMDGTCVNHKRCSLRPGGAHNRISLEHEQEFTTA